ncbi:MAG: nucleotidyltransferase [Candidatus Zixiibacteriota bacterium]|nr:MAG: nucleotidyltransferase [candidate division Zixibacteria bacterium]
MVDRWIQVYKREALPRLIREFQPQRILFFGSRVLGTSRPESDLDVIVVSDRFQGIPFLRRMPMVLQAVPFEKHVDYLCYTPAEFVVIQDESAVVMEAMEHALEVSIHTDNIP